MRSGIELRREHQWLYVSKKPHSYRPDDAAGAPEHPDPMEAQATTATVELLMPQGTSSVATSYST